MKMSRVLEILKRFKDSCRDRGWRTSENEDWVEVGDCYHNFLWTRDVHVSSFKKITLNGKCVVREGLSYRVVKASYMAWLFSKTPSEALFNTVLENPALPSRIALYDLSPFLEGRQDCVKLNNTDSPVFQEFENFLKNEYNIRLRPLSDSGISSDSFTVVELA